MSVSPQAASAILEALGSLGFDVRRLGIHHLRDDADFARLWEKVIALTGRRSLPLEVGLMMPMGAMGAIDYLAASSASVGAALTMAQRLFPLVGPGVQLHIERGRSGGRRVSIVNQPPFPGQAASDLLVLGILLGRLRQFARDPVTLTSVHLTQPRPRDEGRWCLLLDARRVHFGARRAGFELASRVWDWPLRGSDPRLLATLSQTLGVDVRGGDALLVTLRVLATQALPNALTLLEAAAATGNSRRTLQRKLAEHETTLSQLVDEARRQRAEYLVEQGGSSLGEVAARVGFRQAASFTRAWYRWFGVAPSRASLPAT